MTLRIPILASARALARSSSILTGYPTCELVTATWKRIERSHSTFSSDHRQFKILMSLPNDKVVHSSSSISLRPPATFALPPRPTFSAPLPTSNRERSPGPGSRARAHSPVKRSWREVDTYQARSRSRSRTRSPPRRDYGTYNSRSTSSTFHRRDTDSYEARSPPPRETDRYTPRSPRRAEADRYIPDRSSSTPSPRRTDTYIPTDSKNPLRTWTDSYRPDKLRGRREYSTSRSRSPEKPSRKPSQDYRRDRSRSSSSTRDRTKRETSRGKQFGLLSPPRSEKRDRDHSPEPPAYVHFVPVLYVELIACRNCTQKRPISRPAQERPAKVAKPTAIPTGPRAQAPSIPIHSAQVPRTHTPIPTGPRAERNQSQIGIAQTALAGSATTQLSGSQIAEKENEETDEMAGQRGRGRGGGAKGGQTPRSQAPLQPPLMDRARIMEMYGKGVMVKEQWVENPKSPLANHVGNSMPIKYEAQTGLVNGKKVFRSIPSSGLQGEKLMKQGVGIGRPAAWHCWCW